VGEKSCIIIQGLSALSTIGQNVFMLSQNISVHNWIIGSEENLKI